MQLVTTRLFFLHAITLSILSAFAVPAFSAAGFASRDPAEKARLTEFARQIQQTMSAGDPSLFIKSFDGDTFVDRVEARVPASAGFAAGFRDSISPKFGSQFSDGIVKSLGMHGSYVFLRTGTPAAGDGDATRLIFRLVGKGGLNYHQLLVRKDAKSPDQFRIIDVDIAVSGELMSETLKHSYLVGAFSGSKGEHSMPPSIMAINSMTSAINANKPDTAISVYDGLSPKDQSDRLVSLLYIKALRATGKASNDKYIAALEAFSKQHADDPCADLMSIDVLTSQKKYDDLLAVLDRIDTAYGPDAYVDVLRATATLRLGKTDEALALDRKAVELEPGLYQAHDGLLGKSLAAKDYATTEAELLEMHRRFASRFEPSLNNAPLFADFKKSPEYNDWLTKCAASASETTKPAE